MEMFCRNCGYKFDNENDKFCPKCGAPRGVGDERKDPSPDEPGGAQRSPENAPQPAPAQPAAPAAAAPAAPQQKPDNWRVWVYVVLTFVWAFTQEALLGWGSAALLLWDNVAVNAYLAPGSISYFWSIFVPPVYLWRRSTELKEGRGLFWITAIGLGIGIYIMLATAPLRILYGM